MSNKTEQLHIRLSTHEKEVLANMAVQKGITVSELIRLWIKHLETKLA